MAGRTRVDTTRFTAKSAQRRRPNGPGIARTRVRQLVGDRVMSDVVRVIVPEGARAVILGTLEIIGTDDFAPEWEWFSKEIRKQLDGSGISMNEQKPSIGRMVHFTPRAGICRAAIVTELTYHDAALTEPTGNVALAVFGPAGVSFEDDVSPGRRDDAAGAPSWHWPERD